MIIFFNLGVFQPECVGSDSIGAWVDFWKRTYASVVSPASTPSEESSNDAAGAPSSVSSSHWLIFAPKQLLLLAQSMSPRQSWCHVTVLILQLLRSDLVSFKQVQEQAVAVLRQEWPQVILIFKSFPCFQFLSHSFFLFLFRRNCWGVLLPAFEIL